MVSPKKRVVVTGLGCVSPLGKNVESTWKAILEGRSGARTIESFDPSSLDVRFACEVVDFNPEDYLPRKDLRRMDRFIQLGFAASMQAIEEAKIDDSVDHDRVGVLLSSGIGGLPGIEKAAVDLNSGRGRISPFFIPSTIANLLAGHVSMAKNFRGPNQCIVTACSSSAHSIGESYRMILRGDADVMVAGGAEATICRLGIAGFAAMKALSSRNDEPEKASRPFDVGRDGFVMGEGSATMVLEDREHALKRGAKILGEIVGYGANADAYHMTAPTPDGSGARRCMELAVKDAGIDVGSLDYINLHGTSTPTGDIAESKAVKELLGSNADGVACSSTKSMTGHLLGAAGSIEAIFCLLAIRDGKIPPTINLDEQDPDCPLDYTAHKPKEKNVSYALSNSFGFGGTNATLLFSAADK